LFSLAGHDLSGATVLDAFGGSGLLGLEAWSRGAVVTIVERDRRAIGRIRDNAASLGADVDIRAGDLEALVADFEPFEIILVDPPYSQDPGPILTLLAPLVADRLFLETDKRTPLPPGKGSLKLMKTRSYGGTNLSVYGRG
jgi:16S rRNA (guanine966-N2)-methyltransferase